MTKDAVRPASRRRLLFVLVVCGIATVCSVRYFSDRSGNPDDDLIRVNAEELGRTVVTAHMAQTLDAGTNVLWCVTLQLAWNELCAVAGGSVKLDPPVAMAEELNKQAVTGDDLDDASYVALAGRLDEGIYEKIRAELARKFGGSAKPRLQRSPHIGRPQDVFAYAYLFKDVSFAVPFEDLSSPLRFGDAEVRCFGIGYEKDVPPDMAEQVRIYEFDEAMGRVVIELCSKSEQDQLILAMVPAQRTLGETVAAVLKQVGEGGYTPLQPDDVLKVPKLNFDVRRTYGELIGMAVQPTSARMPSDGMIVGAVQDIRFRLDEKGALLRSEAHLAIGCAAKMPPRRLVFDRPFLIAMKLREAVNPHFAMWVGNAELLVNVAERPAELKRRELR